MPFAITAARAAKHMWEEPCISGKNGSGTVFFSGCQLRCCYCQNSEISSKCFGKKISPTELCDIFKRLEAEGVHNINLVSPTPYVPLILKAFDIYKPQLPIVYNSGGYESESTIEMLKGAVDIYLLDYKYSSSEKAGKYSAAADYPVVAERALKKAYETVGVPKFDSDGIMKSGVIVRHLLLPFATKDAAEVMRRVKSMNIDVIFSLMGQYTVMPNVEFKELQRRVTKREYEKTVLEMERLGLKGYVQELDSAKSTYIPSFDLTGM